MNIAKIFYEMDYYVSRMEFGVEIETGLSVDTMYYRDEYDEEWEYTDFAYDVAHIVGIDVSRIYEDGSCGIEIPTSTYYSPKDFRKALKRLEEIFSYYHYDYSDCLSPKHGAGGHFNISFPDFYENAKFICKSIYPFVPLLVYMFGHGLTYRRSSGYRYMHSDIFSDSREIHEKYHWLHRKQYALEFRFPDSPAKINYSVALYYTLIGLSITASMEKLNDVSAEMERDENLSECISSMYHKLISGDELDGTDEIILYNLLNFMLEYLEEYIQFLWDAHGIDLKGALLYCFVNPCYERYHDMPDEVFEYFMYGSW